ncbi:lanthionine synthetase C family protein [Streptomyces sp. NPDC056061]|uniref:lanthionine synthetase C family protein n=1 Tax=Streptomyces sp. NPDC056061 TaxID=3345700 RepID=UPI0035E1EC5A
MARTYAQEALRISDLIAEKLADPARVHDQVWAPEELLPESQRWYPLSLGSGLTGISLLFSNRIERDPGSAAFTHKYLAESLAALRRTDRIKGLYNDVSSLAFATWVAHRATGGYVQAVGKLDTHVRYVSETMVSMVGDGPCRSFQDFDVLSGLTGIGRYLLMRKDTMGEELEGVLSALVRMASDVEYGGSRVPGYWSLVPPTADPDRALPFGADGHLNLGLAHGIAGPLALLSLSWSAGVVVDGQRGAVERLVGLLDDWSLRDERGVFWPGWVSFDEWRAGEVGPWRRKRPSWCYGSPGVSRALQLAGHALGRPDWSDLAVRSVASQLSVPPSDWVVHDASACHGWAGALHLLQFFEEDCPQVSRVLDDIVVGIIGSFDTDSAFGLRFTVEGSDGTADFPGFLDGAAGVGLALESYARGNTTAGEWGAALLTV